MSWLKDFLIGLKDSYKTDIKIMIAVLVVFLVVAGIFTLFELMM